MRKTKQQENDDIIAFFDENNEGLAGKGIFRKIGVTQEISTKELNLKGKIDSDIIQDLKNKFKKIIFITGDSEREKTKKDFIPLKNIGIIRFGKKTTQLSLPKKENLLKKLTGEGLRDKKSFLGREIGINSSGFKKSFYKTGYTNFVRWKSNIKDK